MTDTSGDTQRRVRRKQEDRTAQAITALRSVAF